MLLCIANSKLHGISFHRWRTTCFHLGFQKTKLLLRAHTLEIMKLSHKMLGVRGNNTSQISACQSLRGNYHTIVSGRTQVLRLCSADLKHEFFSNHPALHFCCAHLKNWHYNRPLARLFMNMCVCVLKWKALDMYRIFFAGMMWITLLWLNRFSMNLNLHPTLNKTVD